MHWRSKWPRRKCTLACYINTRQYRLAAGEEYLRNFSPGVSLFNELQVLQPLSRQ